MSSQKLKNQKDSIKAKGIRLKLYEQTVQNFPCSTAIVDSNYVYRAVNKAYAQRHGRPQEQIVGRSEVEIMGRQVFEDIIKPHLDRSLAGETVNFQVWIIHPVLGRRYVDACYYPLPDERGSVKHVAVVIRDITEHESAERALKESEQRYRTLIEGANDIIYSLDPKTGIINSCNGFAEKTLGYKKKDVWGKMHFLDLIHPDDRERLTKQFKRVFLGGERRPNYPFRLRKADGAYIDVEQNATILRDASGEPYDCIGVVRDVTERKRMEEAVRLSEERYHQILNTTLDYILIMDANARVLYANRAWHENVTYTLEELSGPKVFETIHPDDRQEVLRRFQMAVAGASARNVEYRGIRKDGEIRWMEANANPIHWPGADTAVLTVVRDITDRKRIEEELRLSEERYHRILDSSHDVIVVADQSAKILFANKAYQADSGYTIDETNDLGLFHILHPEDREEAMRSFREVLNGEPLRNFECRRINKNGEVRWVESNVDPIHWPGAEKTLLTVTRDITDRKRMEEELHKSEQKFRSLVEMTSDWVWEVDQHVRYTYASPKLKELLGYEPEEIIGKTPFDLMPPDEAERVREYLKAETKSWKPFAGLENINLHKDGRRVVLETSGVPIVDADGNLLGYRGIDRDITERKRNEEALRQSEERYRSMFQEAPDIFYTMDLETWVITDANKRALEALEYGPEGIGRVHISALVHPDDYERAANRLREMVINKDRQPNFPLRILTRTGRIHHIEQSGVIFWDENGQAKSFLGLAHDVTHLKKQEEMIRRRNEKLAALYEVARAVNESLSLETIIDLAMEAIPTVTNSDAVSMYLYDEDTQTLKYCAYRGFPEDLIRGTDGMKLGEGIHGHVAQTRQPLVLQDALKHPLLGRRAHTTKVEYGSAMVVPLMVMDELHGILTVARKPGKHYGEEDLDLLTALANIVAVAMHRAHLYSRVLQREKHLESILETSQDGIGIWFDHHAIYLNSALITMLGYDSFDEMKGLDTMSFFAPESRRVLELVRRKLDRRERIDGTLRYKVIRKDGSTLDVEARVDHFYEGDQRYVVVVLRDVTERKRMEFQLQQSSKLAAIGELAAGVAHEINNPLATIDIQTGLIREIIRDGRENLGGALFDRLDKYLSIMEDQVQKCQSVTNHLLSFSRIPKSRREAFEVNELLKKTVELVVRLTEGKPEIEMSLDERRPLFWGDPNRLEQVFVNLLNNALKAIEPGGSIAITTCLDDDGSIHVEFKDSGCGIPDEIKHRIFDPFFTTRPEGEGTGLGLSICYYIVKEMNGKLDVESSPEQGTTFIITLPGDAEAMESSHVY